jgi:hypothetical protein
MKKSRISAMSSNLLEATKMNMKKTILTWILAGFSAVSLGQAVTVANPGDMDPTKEITIIVDLTQTSNEWGIVEAAASGEDMYIWTWQPAEHPVGHPRVNGIGATAWKNSNEALKMTKVSEGVYSYTMVPTEFYEVEAKEVYDKDIHFLVKPKDGGGYGDPDIKTEDLLLEFELPKGASTIFTSIPNPFGPDLDSLKIGMDDIFSLKYDNNEDTKPSLEGVQEMYIYPEITGTDSVVYTVAPNAKQVGNYPSLKMTNRGDGTFQFSHIMSNYIALFQLPPGVEPRSMTVLCVRPNLKNTNDIVDDDLAVTFIWCN